MSENSSWKDTQSKLLQDIEAFARSEPNLAEINAAQNARPAAKPAVTAAPSAAATVRAAAPATPAAAPAPAAPQAPAPGGSLLERLKREALAKQMTDSQIFTLQGQQQAAISSALQSTFQYLREFCEQLNILKPAYPLGYNLLGIVNLEGLTWQEGRADFRLVPGAKEEKLFDQVTLRFRLTSGQQMRIEREAPAHEAFRKALVDANIAYQEEEFRNQKSRVEKAVFTFTGEVKAGLAFAADYKEGNIRLLARNIRRFGAAEYRLPFEALNQETFEEIARLVLGEENRIDKIFRRVA